MNLNILKYPECPCCLQNGDFEDKSKNVQEVSGMPAAESRGLWVKHNSFWKIKKLPFLNASSFLDSWNRTGEYCAVKPRENTSSCRASGRKSSPFPRDPSVALLTAAWYDCTCIKTHLNGKPTFSSPEHTAVTVGSLETSAMLEFSRLQRISVLPTEMIFTFPDKLFGYNCTVHL